MKSTKILIFASLISVGVFAFLAKNLFTGVLSNHDSFSGSTISQIPTVSSGSTLKKTNSGEILSSPHWKAILEEWSKVDNTNNHIKNPPELPGLPIDHALDRITKKSFGIYVSPGHSPVSPERFSGYHTGADFETTPDEQNTDMAISAVCTGPMVLEKWATWYGGVAIQRCKIWDQSVTIIYGHLRVSSLTIPVSRVAQIGDQIGILGTWYSHETDGERKHLHLAIHKGTGINILGYVASKNSLRNWIDPVSLFR